MTGTPELLQKGVSIACGDSRLCAEALVHDYAPTLRSDPCTIPTEADFNAHVEEYLLWLPKYRRKSCDGSGYLNCAAETERFGPRQVTQESFIQGRGQVTPNPGCPAGGVTYLPENQFDAAEPRRTARDMSLFAQPTTLPRSCGTLTEVDLRHRLQPLPGVWQSSFSPLAGLRSAPPKAAERKTVTLGTKNKYPDWGELKEQSEPYGD